MEMKTKFDELFAAFGKAPMHDILELAFDGLSEQERKELTIESVSYTRYSPTLVSFEVSLCVNADADKWISWYIEKDEDKGKLREHIQSKFNLGYQDSMRPISECIELYNEVNHPRS